MCMCVCMNVCMYACMYELVLVCVCMVWFCTAQGQGLRDTAQNATGTYNLSPAHGLDHSKAVTQHLRSAMPPSRRPAHGQAWAYTWEKEKMTGRNPTATDSLCTAHGLGQSKPAKQSLGCAKPDHTHTHQHQLIHTCIHTYIHAYFFFF